MQEVQMGEMVERAARALYVAEVGGEAGWDDRIGEKGRDVFRMRVRAVIEAMRDPTQDMIDACDINIPTEGEIVGVWDDMISAALK
jgi:hypothetical protein